MAKPAGLIALLTEGGAGGGGAKERAIEDFWAAQKKGDSKAGAEAFQRAYDICRQKAAKPEAEETEPEAEEDDDEDELLAG
jgi:hypothetical protein